MAGVFRARARNEERGAIAPLMALATVVVVAAAGLGVDTGNLVMQRDQAQHAADSSAMAIANDCALGHSTCSPAGNAATADYFIDQNAPNATTLGPVIPSTGGRVSVTVTEDVPTSLMSIVGIDSGLVEAKATAIWGGHPVVGDPVLPLAIPYCQWYANRPGATTDPVELRTDLIARTFETISNPLVADLPITTLVGSLLGVSQSCDLPDGTDAVMLRGPVWLTGITEVLSGVLPTFFPSECKMHLDDVNVLVGGTLSSAIEPSCIDKLGSSIKVGDTILLPIYKPANNLLRLGLQTRTCLLGTCVKVPPRLGVTIMGYAPFKITGWNFAGNTTNPSCGSLSTPTITVGLVQVPGLSIGCAGLVGHFVRTTVPDPNFTYAPEGADFGATEARLIE